MTDLKRAWSHSRHEKIFSTWCDNTRRQDRDTEVVFLFLGNDIDNRDRVLQSYDMRGCKTAKLP
jgi:hypothetical protein